MTQQRLERGQGGGGERDGGNQIRFLPKKAILCEVLKQANIRKRRRDTEAINRNHQ